MMGFNRWVASLALLIAAVVHADATTDATRKAEAEQAWSAARKVAVRGPQDVPLLDQANLHLDKGKVFIPKTEAAGLMRVWGNTPSDDLIGLVMPEQGEWFSELRYVKSGFIKDDDAKDWNADDLLKSVREGTEESNKERASRGIPELDILGWAEKPAYSVDNHHLVWSISAKEKGSNDPDLVINYNTYALGRDGYFVLDMVTQQSHVAADKLIAQSMLSDLKYNSGKAYTDFKAGTDKVAEYGLAALVVGVAAKKLGLLAMAGLFFAKFFKLILLAVVGGFAAIKKFLGIRKKEA